MPFQHVHTHSTSSTCRMNRLQLSWRWRPSARTWGTCVNVVWVSLWESLAVILLCVTLWSVPQLPPGVLIFQPNCNGPPCCFLNRCTRLDHLTHTPPHPSRSPPTCLPHHTSDDDVSGYRSSVWDGGAADFSLSSLGIKKSDLCGHAEGYSACLKEEEVQIYSFECVILNKYQFIWFTYPMLKVTLNK